MVDHDKLQSDFLKHLRRENYVLLMGVKGGGRTTFLKKAEKEIRSELGKRTAFFSVAKILHSEGVYGFYTSVIKAVVGDNIALDKNDLSSSFRDILAGVQFESIVLIFDDCENTPISQSVLLKFFSDCRAIYTEGRVGISSYTGLLMVFCGAQISYKDFENSPIWNITQKLNIEPPSGEYLLKNLLDDSDANDVLSDADLRDILQGAIQGNWTLAKFFVDYYFEKREGLSVKRLLSSFVETILSAIEEKGGRECVIFFRKMLYSLVLDGDLLEAIFELLDGQSAPSRSVQDPFDHVSSTGIVVKSKDQMYHFANNIYKEIFTQLKCQGWLNDFCLFHPERGTLLTRRKSALTEKAGEMRLVRAIYPMFEINKYYFPQLQRSLNDLFTGLEDTESLCNECDYIFRTVFNISSYAVLEILYQGNSVEELTFDEKFIGRDNDYPIDVAIQALRSGNPLTDWSERYHFVPVRISENFRRIFVYRAEAISEVMAKAMVVLLTNVCLHYHYLLDREEHQKALEKLTRQLTPSDAGDGSFSREAETFWPIFKEIFHRFGITFTKYYECFSDGCCTLSKPGDEKLSCDRQENAKITGRVKNLLEKGLESHNGAYRYKYTLTEYKTALLEFSSECKKEDLQQNLAEIFSIIKHLSESRIKERDALIIRESLLNNEDYIYIIDNERRVLFVNEKLQAVVKDNSPAHTFCYEQLGFDDQCNDCPCYSLFERPAKIRVVREVTFDPSEGRRTMLCSVFPIRGKDQNNEVVAVACHMHDITERQILWQATQEMGSLKKPVELEKYIFKTLSKFGFSNVFQWQLSENGEKFISEDYAGPIKNKARGEDFRKGKEEFDAPGQDQNSDSELMEKRLIVWYRKNSTRTELIQNIKSMLHGTKFKIKESTVWPPHTEDNQRPDFWVTVPLFIDDTLQFFYALNNQREVEDNYEIISLDRLQILETFIKAAGQMLDNLRKRDANEQFRGELVHAIKEPLQIMRMALYRVREEDDVSERKKIIGKTDGALALAQSAIDSLAATGNNRRILNMQNVDCCKLLEDVTGIFAEYISCEGYTMKIDCSDDLVCFTDKLYLTIILNNLVGNAARYRQPADENVIRIKAYREKNGSVCFSIANSGEMPAQVQSYLRQENLHLAKNEIAGGSGLVASKKIAKLLGGSLTLVRSEPGMRTTLQLTIRNSN